MAAVVLEADVNGFFDLDKAPGPARGARAPKGRRTPTGVPKAAAPAGPDEDDEWVKVASWEWEASPAAELKDLGNEAFRAGDYAGAIAKYSAALDEAPDAPEGKAALYANRAAAHAKRGSHVAVVTDCSSCLALEGAYVKALVRRANALEKLGHRLEAIEDLEAALAADVRGPALAKAKADLVRLRKMEKRTAE